MDKVSNQSKNPTRLTSKNFLLLLLEFIDQKIPVHSCNPKRDCITKRSGKSKQALNYHLQKLVKKGILTHPQSFPFAIYELTSFGKQVKKHLIQSDGVRTLWRCHHLIVGYEIKSFGNFRFIDTKNRKIVPMENWKYAREEFKKSFEDTYVVHVQETGLLKIYCPKTYHIYPDQAFGIMYNDSGRIAQFYCDRYSMVLNPMRVIRRGHKALVKSEKLVEAVGRFNIDGKVWTDASEGEELEERQDSYTVDDLLNLPGRINRLTEVNLKLASNIELHLSVMSEIKDAIKEMRDLFRIMNGNSKNLSEK